MTDSKPTEDRNEKEHQQRDAALEEETSELSNSNPTEERDEKEQEEWYERTRYQILLFAGGIALFGLALGLILDWYIDPQNSTQKKDLVQALGLITAGVAGAVGIFFTWRGQRLAREAEEHNQRNTQEQLRLSRLSQEQTQQSTQAQLENAQEELRLTRQGQITERFTRAIEQLGSEKLELRLGGIYALERIDKESPERAYHSTVMEVLTAYVRENSPWELEEPSTSTTASNEDVEQDKGVERDEKPPVQRPPTDIQAIVDVLKRREEDHVPKQHRVHLDLRGADLHTADLHTADLHRANLRGANLNRAILQEANLQGANLRETDLREAYLPIANLYGANLYGANLRGADLQEAILQHTYFMGANLRETYLQRVKLQGANLQGARLQGANLQGANLQSAIFYTADLRGADLRGADLRGADLRGADLQKAELQGANLQGADLQGANLRGANLRGANLRGADFQRAIFQGADLQGANLQGANLQSAIFYTADLRGADLRGADLRGADLRGADLREARGITENQIERTLGSNTTKLPEDLDPPELWSKSDEEQLRIVREHLGG